MQPSSLLVITNKYTMLEVGVCVCVRKNGFERKQHVCLIKHYYGSHSLKSVLNAFAVVVVNTFFTIRKLFRGSVCISYYFCW